MWAAQNTNLIFRATGIDIIKRIVNMVRLQLNSCIRKRRFWAIAALFVITIFLVVFGVRERQHYSVTMLSGQAGTDLNFRVAEARVSESAFLAHCRKLLGFANRSDDIILRTYLSEPNGKNEWLIHSVFAFSPGGVPSTMQIHNVLSNGELAIVDWMDNGHRRQIDIIRIDMKKREAKFLDREEQIDFGNFETNLKVSPDLSCVETDHSGMLDRPTTRYTYKINGDKIKWEKKLVDVDPFDWKGSFK